MATMADFHGSMYMMLATNKRGQNRPRCLLPVGSTMAAATSDPVWREGGWRQYPDPDTDNIQHSDNAYNTLLIMGEEVQEKWLTQGSDDQPITKLQLNAYKYDDLKTDNVYVGFYFLRVDAGSFILYCRMGLLRQRYNPSKICKLSSNEIDVYN